MSGQEPEERMYDRQLLLLGPKRNEVLDLREIRGYGVDSFGDADYTSIFGLTPEDWYSKGIRLLGRTVVECTRDEVADAIGADVARIAKAGAAFSRVTVLDPFVGSGNTLYWILHHMPGATGLGFEVDPLVFALTRQNLSILELQLNILETDYEHAVRGLILPNDSLLVAFIAPPWGTALSPTQGLDLRRTSPPVGDVIDLFAHHLPNRMLFAIQLYERVESASLAELTQRFDWWGRCLYDLNPPGQNAGLLLATMRWRPS